MTFNFDLFFDTVKKGVVDIAKEEAADFLDQAKDDGTAFLEESKDRLKKWTQMLKDGTLDKDDFAFLIKGQKDLAKMNGLTQAGMAAVRIDRIRVAVIDLVIKAAGAIV